jgi:uncharacterized membrane protein
VGNNYFVSLIRTWVPLLVGVVLTWLARRYDIVIDETVSSTTVTAVTGIVTGIYYAIVRFLEVKVAPGYGWLLGAAKKPAYSPPAGG